MAVSSIHRDNFFDVIRLVASFLVLYSHQFPLSGLAEPSFLGFTSFGGLAVIIFFGVSGYLVAQSGIRSGDFLIFMTKRIKRIFPALIFCGFVIFLALLFSQAGFLLRAHCILLLIWFFCAAQMPCLWLMDLSILML